MRRGISYIVGIAAAVMLVLVLFITSLELVAFNQAYYQSEYRKLQRPQTIGISEDELMKVTGKLLDYMEGKTDNLNIKAKILGHTVEVFSDRDKAHMVDVRNLYLFWRGFRNVGAIVVAAAMLIIILFMRRDASKVMARAFLIGAGTVTLILLVVGLWAALDFSGFWTTFHLIFFTNDLWMLDPQQSVLIQMVPEQFFYDTVTRILSYFGIAMLVLFVLSAVTLMVRKQRSQALYSAKRRNT